MDSKATIISSLKNFFSGTLLSRVSGLLREVAMAFVFGVTPGVASFWMAFRFANLFRRLFGEGGLNMAFIPHYESLKKKDPIEAATFFYNLTESLTYFLIILVVVTEVALGSFLFFGNVSKETQNILELTMIMLPALIFLSLYALNTALLNTEKKFFLPSAAPSLVNLVWVFGLLFLQRYSENKALTFLAMIVVFGFAAQWFVTALPTYSLMRSASKKKGMNKELLLFLRPFLLTIIGVTSQQINSAIDALFAKAADPEGPALLWYALRLQQLPFALFGVGLMNALLPPLSRAESEEKYQSLLNFSLKKVAAFMIPLSMAIMAGGFAAVNLLFGRGAFSEKATYETTLCLMAYGMSLLPMGWTLLLSSAFFAKKEYKIPTMCSLLSIACNIILNAFFVYGLHLSAISIAIATTIASLFNVLILSYYLSKRSPHFGAGLIKKSVQVAAISMTAAVTTIVASGWILKDNTLNLLMGKALHPFERSIEMQGLHMAIVGVLFVGTFALLAFSFKLEEFMPSNFRAIRSRKHQEY